MSPREAAIAAVREARDAAVKAADERHDEACRAAGFAWRLEMAEIRDRLLEDLARIDRDHPKEAPDA